MRERRWLTVLLLLLLCNAAADEARYMAMRERMISEIAEDAELTSHYIDKRALDPRVMEVMARVPRHRFVPAEQEPYAYDNRPLSIGFGQTISQPYIVALMSDLLRPSPEHRVLELGTGSGYQAAVLAELCSEVFSIELEAELAERARADLARLGYRNVNVRQGNGYLGWPEQAPFDAIVVTAAPPDIPPLLVEQLALGGRMVLPVGRAFQELQLVTRTEEGIERKSLMGVRFVPMREEPER